MKLLSLTSCVLLCASVVGEASAADHVKTESPEMKIEDEENPSARIPIASSLQ